ncbi:MAG: aminodeoxychorismate/anthranilate synthase component II [Methanomicrobiaceae archaeon]|nr:aminodeoxychorismate/anthranilate synthase component II [Methanomicrobiaceae archaeon]
MRVLIVDCYDSFTFNLYQQVGALGGEPVVVKNDASPDVLEAIECDRIILSPGPGIPENSGLCLAVLDGPARAVPTLGVCLGFQAICIAFGGKVVRADHLMHGKTSAIHHDGKGIFRHLPVPLLATRYHSLIADPASLPESLAITATSGDDGYVMGVRHRTYPIEGIQFHPESILTREGDALIRNFLSDDGGRRGG